MALDTVKNTSPCPAPAQGPGVESAHPPAGVGVHHVGVEAVVGEVQHPAQQEEAPAQTQHHRYVIPGHDDDITTLLINGCILSTDLARG